MADDDMHQHRRSTDTDDLHGHRLQAAADSTAAKVVNRLVSPVIGVLITVIGFFLVRTLNDVAANQLEQGRDLAQVKSDVRNINTRLDEGVIRQVNANTQQITDHEHRIQAIERAVPTP